MVDIGVTASLNSNSQLLSLFGASASSSTPTMSAEAGFPIFVQNENQQVAKFAQEASVQQAVSYFKSHISQVKSVADLTKDPKLLNFVLTAFGLQDAVNQPALVAGVLNSNLSKSNSLANELADPRYQQLAQEFNVAVFGTTNFQNSNVIADVVNKYLTNAYEISLDSTNSALRDAAYFLRNIGSVTNAYNILADPVLRNVVETATGLPQTIANLPIQDEARLINQKVNIKSFETSSSSSSTGSSSSASSTTTALSTDQGQLSALSSATAVVTAAQTAVQNIVNQITAVTQAQANLSNIQSATGPFAAEIPVQQAAAPKLIEQQGLLAAAQKATGSVTSNLSQLQSLVTQAGDPNNTTPISTLQSEFTTLVSSITSAISGATYQFDNNTGGTTYTSQNLVDGSLGSAITVQYDSTGDTVTVNPQNLGSGSSFQTALNAAEAAFTSVTPNFTTAAAQLTTAQNAANVVSTQVNSDASNFASAISSVSAPFSKWAGTYNTASVYLGSQSVVDAGARLTTINLLISQIQNVAQTSAQASTTADRTTVQNQFTSVLSQLGTAINSTNTSGVDNLLNSATNRSYNVIGNYDIQAQGQDLVTNVLNQLSSLDVSTQADANAVLAAIASGSTVQTALTQASTQIGVDSQYFATASTIDPASTVYSQYATLTSQVPVLVNQAQSGSTNLLSVNQVLPITVTANAANQVITINPESNFNSGVQQTLTTGASQLLTNPTQAFSTLNTASFNANNILNDLNGELNQLQYATNVTNAAIKNLQSQQAAIPATVGVPVHATAYAMNFVKQYLAQVDAAAAANGTGAGSGAVSLLPLFQGQTSIGNTSAISSSLNSIASLGSKLSILV
ncbi:MAG TPA: DUF1217 domain-containing protein [Alphaproteobacteria bacterium]|nr:DUF1217 domain-containing protein [Alphaproteobacteria bacterium]